ncbi:MAG: hypothetical protein LBR18_08775 [Tannerella sp.]|nr:hypothetical protein [Tannerella sp.]
MYKLEQNFIERTVRLVKSYRDNKTITLLINCMLGLLVFPKEKYLDTIPDVSFTVWGIGKDHVSKCLSDGNESEESKDFVRHLRNAVCHGNFRIQSAGNGNDITDIDFHDYPRGNPQNQENFSARIPVGELKAFLLKFAEAILQELQKMSNTNN